MTDARWRGPGLDEVQSDLLTMLDAFVATHDLPLEDDHRTVGDLRAALAELGIWTIGTAESAGGGGADRNTASLAFERLGGAWPALAWAAVQAHAAVDVLGGDDRFDGLVSGIHAAETGVAVLDTASPHVRVRIDENGVAGTVDRIDAAAPAAHLVILDGEHDAVVVPNEAVTAKPLKRSGFGGAFTHSARIEAGPAQIRRLTDVDGGRVRSRLRLGAAAVAAGIAGRAADTAIDYASARHQFGGALTAIPTVRKALFEQSSAATNLLSAVFGAPDDPTASAAIAVCATDRAIDVAAAAVQSHGGYGYLTEYGIERRLRDAVSLRAACDSFGIATGSAREVSGLRPLAGHDAEKEAS